MTYESFKMLAWYRDRGSNADMRQQCESLINQEILRVLRALQEAEARRASIRSGVTFEERPSMPPPLQREIERMMMGGGINTTDISAAHGITGTTGIYTAASSSASPSISSAVGTC